MIALAVSVGLWGYAYVGYPLALFLATAARRAAPRRRTIVALPTISIVVPAYNEAASIARTLDAVLALDYPADRRQVLVLSDASSDGTDDIVAGYAARGVQLLRMPRRAGKTAAENYARAFLTGEIVINTDASVRPHRDSLRHLVAAFADPDVGVASSRDVSVARLDATATAGESTYVGYEMWVRSLETKLGGIVGASGSLYGIRRHLHDYVLPETLSRDFGAALEARQRGYRAVSVAEAICFVPRGVSLRQEYRRKVRTMTRGLATLVHFSPLLNPFKFGIFAWMLASHKLVRWLLPWATVLMVASIAVAARHDVSARAVLALFGVGGLLAIAGWRWPEHHTIPRVLALPTYLAAGIVAGLHAWIRLFLNRPAPTWEPTRRSESVIGP